MKKLVLLAVVLAFLAGPGPFPSVGQLWADEKLQFLVDNDQWVALKGQTKFEPPTPNGAEETAAGWIFWLYADPQSDQDAAGAERGLYLYKQRGKKYSFLAFGNPGQNVNALHFSPNGDKFIIESTQDGADCQVGLEVFDLNSLASVYKIENAALSPSWLDNDRFAYSLFEPNTSRNTDSDSCQNWIALAMYNTQNSQSTVLKAATETSNFRLMGLDKNNTVLISEEYVTDPKQWADPEKILERELNVPFN